MYQIEMSLVFIRILREDDNVIDVHPYKKLQLVSKDIIHDALERRWRVTEAKGHINLFEAPNCVLKVVFSTSSSWIWIWWNPLTRSIFKNTVETRALAALLLFKAITMGPRGAWDLTCTHTLCPAHLATGRLVPSPEGNTSHRLSPPHTLPAGP